MFIFFFLLVPLSIPTSLGETTFKFDSFDRSMHDIIYEGDAFPSDQVIQLTGNHTNSSGRATYRAPLHLWDKTSGNLATFITNFSFTIDSQREDAYGNGFTFFMAPNGSRLPPYSNGSNVGLKNGKPNFCAVEFDTYSKKWDPLHEQVRIVLNSLQSVNSSPWLWSDIKGGERAEAWISYDPIFKNITILLTDAYINTKSSSMSYIVDLRKYLPEYVTFGFSASTGGGLEIHSIQSWEFSSSFEVPLNITGPETLPNQTDSSKSLQSWRWFIAGVGSLVLVCLVLYCLCVKRRSRELPSQLVPGHVPRKFSHNELASQMGPGHVPRKFSYNELATATDNFSEERLVGEGGFAKVYRGTLRGDAEPMAIAVKKIIMSQALKDVKKVYMVELKAISQLRHRNLVVLLGWCTQQDQFLIVYEFMINNCLDYHLFQETPTKELTWERRYKIATGLASALHYLQEECEKCVLHRDIKSKNILLDSDFNAKLCDFGLARLVKHGQESTTTTILFGTDGYVAPEYRQSKKPSKESDVYSFGIVLLEIACGKKAIEKVSENGQMVEKILVEDILSIRRQNGEENFVAMAADRRLKKKYDAEQMKRLIVVGLDCAHPNPKERPSIKKALDMLNMENSTA